MCPVSARENLRVTSCNSGSSWKAQDKGRSREGFKDHTWLLISLKFFHPLSFWTSQLCLCGHSSHKCLSVVHGIIPPLACKTFPKKRWAIGVGPLVLFTFLKNFQWREKTPLQTPIPCFLKKWKFPYLKKFQNYFQEACIHAMFGFWRNILKQKIVKKLIFRKQELEEKSNILFIGNYYQRKWMGIWDGANDNIVITACEIYC